MVQMLHKSDSLRGASTHSKSGQHRTSIAAVWSTGGQLVTQAVSLIVGIVLARLLSPQDFGVLAAASIVTTILGVFVNFGVQQIILREAGLCDELLSTVIALNLSIGFFLALITFVFAPQLGLFVGSSGAVVALRILSLSLILVAWGGLPRALLVREMQQRQIARSEIGGMIVYAVVSVMLALTQIGFWALVIGTLASSLATTVFLWHSLRRFVWPRFYWHKLRRIFPFGAQLGVNDALVWGGGMIDNFLTGRMLGEISLGYYTFGFNLAWLPLRKILAVIDSLVQSALAKRIRNRNNPWPAYCKAVTFTSVLIWLPLCMLMVSANELIVIVYGVKWLPAVLPMQIHVAGAAAASLGAYSYGVSALCARSRTYMYLLLARAGLTAVLISVLVAANYGLNGVAIGFMLSFTLILPFEQWFVSRLLNGAYIEFWKSTLPAALASVGAIFMTMAVRLMLGWMTPTLLLLVVSLLTPFVIYLLIVRFVFPQLWCDIQERILNGIRGVLNRRISADELTEIGA